MLGFDPPTWEDLSNGARSPPAELEDMEHASKVEYQHWEELCVLMGLSHRAQLRSQACPGAGVASVVPHAFSHTHPPLFLPRCVCCDILLFPLPPSWHTLRCDSKIDKFGHSCARAGVLGRRGFALKSATARVCREGARRHAPPHVRWVCHRPLHVRAAAPEVRQQLRALVCNLRRHACSILFRRM